MKIKVLPNKQGQFYFNLVARNGKIWATSEAYSSKSKAIRAAERVVEDCQGKLMSIDVKNG